MHPCPLQFLAPSRLSIHEHLPLPKVIVPSTKHPVQISLENCMNQLDSCLRKVLQDWSTSPNLDLIRIPGDLDCQKSLACSPKGPR